MLELHQQRGTGGLAEGTFLLLTLDLVVYFQISLPLTQGSKLELPLWLAKGLFDNKRRILSVELPKIYQEGWRTVFSADANVVDLHKLGPHFYAFGSQLLYFDSPENGDISQSLLQASKGSMAQLYLGNQPGDSNGLSSPMVILPQDTASSWLPQVCLQLVLYLSIPTSTFLYLST